MVTAEKVKARYFGEDQEQKSLKDLFDYHNQQCAHDLGKATVSHYLTTQRYLISEEIIVLVQIHVFFT